MGKKDVILKPVDVKISGQMYKLIYTMRAILYLEDEYGSVEEAMEKLNKEGKTIDTIKILFAGLKVHHKELELDDLIDVLEIQKLPDIMGKMNEAFIEAFGEIDEEKTKEIEKKLKAVDKEKK